MRRRGRAPLPDNPHFAKIQASLHKTTAIGRLCGEIHKQKHRLVEPLLVSGPSFGDFHASKGHLFTHTPANKILEYEKNIEALQGGFAKMSRKCSKVAKMVKNDQKRPKSTFSDSK